MKRQKIYNKALIQIPDFYFDRMTNSITVKNVSKDDIFKAAIHVYQNFVIPRLVQRKPISVYIIWDLINKYLKSKTSRIHRGWIVINPIILSRLVKRYSKLLKIKLTRKNLLSAISENFSSFFIKKIASKNAKITYEMIVRDLLLRLKQTKKSSLEVDMEPKLSTLVQEMAKMIERRRSDNNDEEEKYSSRKIAFSVIVPSHLFSRLKDKIERDKGIELSEDAIKKNFEEYVSKEFIQDIIDGKDINDIIDGIIEG